MTWAFILLGVAIGIVASELFYRLVLLPERERFADRVITRLENEVFQWKELALSLTQRGLLFRELPLLNEDVEALSRPPRETIPDEEKSLEELEAEMAEMTGEMDFTSQGELGERRRLAREIALRKRDAGLKNKSELATESSVNTFGPADMEHLTQ